MSSAGVSGGADISETGASEQTKNMVNAGLAQLGERAVRMVGKHAGDGASERAAMRSNAEKLGCKPQMLRLWVRQVTAAAHDTGTLARPLEQVRVGPGRCGAPACL